jgi:hypothetical protein
MRRETVLTTLRWISAFVNVTLHSCLPAYAGDFHGLSVVATIDSDEASLEYASVQRNGCNHSEGRDQRLTMTHHGGRKMTDMWQSAGASEATAASTPLLLRSTVFQDGSQDSCPSDRSFEQLLLEHCERILSGGRSQTLIVQLELGFEGSCPETHEKTVLRVADELLSNAMEHGFYCRERGHVFVHVVSRAGVGVQVSVSDDGWGFDSGPIIDGNGFHLLRQIGDLYMGAVAGPFWAKTGVTVIIPLHHCRAIDGSPDHSRHAAII